MKNKSESKLKEMYALAKSRDGACLSDKYIGSRKKLDWRCAKGHVWSAVPNSIQNGSWCPRCGRSSKYNLQDMKKLAKQKKGECLSEEYINLQTKLTWKCSKGHVWQALPQSIKQGSWCQRCLIQRISDSLRSNIEEMYSLAKARGGECLSDIYVNMHTKLKWKCADGHVWITKPCFIKQGHWCPHCKRKKNK